MERVSPVLRSMRTKLLIMLAVLSMPLLIVSLYQLNNYRKSLDESASAISRIQAAAESSALASWLDSHPSIVRSSDALTAVERRELALRLHLQSPAEAGTVVAVYDAEGRAIQNLFSPAPVPETINFSGNGVRTAWSDGVERMTSIRRVEPFDWAIAVGVPLAQNTSAGRSIVVLAATWALVMLASILLGVWAAGRFTKPLRQLATLATTLGRGRLRERASVETNDEVGALANGFNVMASQLETKFNELQSQGEFIEEVLDGLPLGVAVLDTNLIVRKVNPTFARFVGREAQTLTGRGLYEAAAGMAVLSDVVEDVRRTRKPFVTYGLPLSLVARSKETSEKPEEQGYWDVTIWPTTVQGDLILILSEVSKRVRAEKLATNAFASERARAAELESVINQMNEGVIIIDRHGRYKMNPSGRRIVGRKWNDFRDGVEALIEDMALRDMSEVVIAPEQTPITRALEKREDISGEQLKIFHASGEARVIALNATPLTGEDGGHEGAVVVFRDITEEVRQHEELVGAYDRLREHDRLKSAFVTNISHELRTPLNVIIGLCQLLERDHQLPLAPLQEEAVTRMERNARSLLEMVNDLLDYSRLEAGRSALHLEQVDVAEVVRETVEDYQRETQGKHIELRAEVAPELGRVLTDKHKLTQVLSNLIGNAVKFTSEGTVTITAAPLDEAHWYMEVSDTGIGISSDALTYIFDEFRQVDDRLARSYGGSGLGLAITRKIVELLEGEIGVESEPQAGSRFRITWPRAVRQRTGTGSLVERSVPAPGTHRDMRLRVR